MTRTAFHGGNGACGVLGRHDRRARGGWFGWTMAVLCLGVLAACDRPEPPRAKGPLRVVVSLPPLEGLVRALEPDAEVRVLIPPGVSEHGYELTSGDVAAIRRADVVVGVGMGLEPRLVEALRTMGDAAPETIWFERVVEGETGDDHAGHEHAHDDHAGHDHGDHAHADDANDDHADHDHGDDGHDHDHGVDPHLWLDPVLVARFIPDLAHALHDAAGAAGLPADHDAMHQRSDAVLERVRAVDAHCRERLAPVAGRAIVTHHASHGRFADRYGLRIAATIRIAESMEPTPEQVRAAVRAIQSENVPAVFVEPQFDSTTAARIADAAGVRAVVLDPVGDGDWFGLLTTTADTIAEALAGGGTESGGTTPAPEAVGSNP
ncbi:MAG: metal ABC transporter substrate-binding protein [Phycisphaerales bacterium]